MSQRIGTRYLTAPVMVGAMAMLLALTLVAGAVSAQGTPEASPVASPQMGECVAASELAAGDVVAATDNFINCFNAGDLETVLTLATENLLADKFGLASAEDAAAALPDAQLLPITVLEYGEPETTEDGRQALPIVYLYGDYQYVAADWIYTESDGALLLDEEDLSPATPTGDTAVVSFAFVDPETVEEASTALGFSVTNTTPQKEVVTLFAQNNSGGARVFSLYLLPEGAAATPVVDASPVAADATPVAEVAVPEGAELVGQISLADAEQGGIIVLSPPVGEYLVVEETSGVSGAFSVTEPVEAGA